MKFIKESNFQDGEKLSYEPKLHWFYSLRHMVLSIPLFLVLVIMYGQAHTTVEMLTRNIFFMLIITVLFVFGWRIFRYLSTEYGVTNKRLIIKRGVLRMVVSEIPINRIESVSCSVGILGRVLKYGDVCVCSTSGQAQVFRMVMRPFALRRRILRAVEKKQPIAARGLKESLRVKPAVRKDPIYRYGTFVNTVRGWR